MSDRKTARRALQIEAGLAEDRQELAALLGQIRYQMEPKVQAQILMADAKDKAEEVKNQVTNTIEAALKGDREAIIKILVGAAGTVAVGTLLFLGIRANTGERRRQKEWRKFTKRLGRTYPPQDIEFTVR